MNRCPYCKERIRKGAVRCKHCHAGIDGNSNTSPYVKDGDVRYIQNGFSKINAECDSIEQRVRKCSGLIFIKHQYSNEYLLEAGSRIESFVEKMKDDLEEWDSLGNLSQKASDLFTRKANEVYERLEAIHDSIAARRLTWWEKVCETFKRILAKLLPFLSIKLIAGKKRPIGIAA